MNMNKTFVFMVLALFLVSVLPLALAQDDNTTTTDDNETVSHDDNETQTEDVEQEDESEVAIMHTPKGAQVRLLQLQKSIEHNILKGQEIVAKILEKNESANVSNLNAILGEMTLLVEEVKSLDINVSNATSNELAQTYVQIKSDARSLAKDFRDEARTYFKDDEQKRLREELKEKYKEQLKDLQEKIKELKKNYNSERLSLYMQRTGIKDSAILERLQNGDKISDIRKDLAESFKSMTSEERKEAALKVKEEKVKMSIFKKDSVEKLKEKFEEKRLEREQNRVQKLEEKGFKMDERREQMQQKADERQQKMQERNKNQKGGSK
ncbi:MAG: hypothetical protein KJ583_03275 [Nanoarchaeota archaeon]|nr:hypothetical protein [Nanoarchaeota archaeon]MBU1269399.1 hypothetical protein [Nanoarchaeota archaeon]MBU1604316.1 hypothetical protein [Nanoarchaeota archaeon]MBU2442887.1 hypothetical protein [Nanoarchaeota archaeon]